MNGKRKINIDYLKAIAIFGVVYTHFWFGGGGA